MIEDKMLHKVYSDIAFLSHYSHICLFIYPMGLKIPSIMYFAGFLILRRANMGFLILCRLLWEKKSLKDFFLPWDFGGIFGGMKNPAILPWDFRF